MCKSDVEIWKPDTLLEFKAISADQHFYCQCPTSLNNWTFLCPSFNMSSLFSHFPKSFDFSLPLACVWEIFENNQHYPSIITTTADCFLTYHFNTVYPFISTQYTTLWNTFKTDNQYSRDTSPASKLFVSRQFLYFLY